MFEYPDVCLGDVWMPPVHTQHIESMLCHTKGVSICPHTFGCPHMYGCTLYVWMPPYVWMAHCMFECPHMFGHPLYVCMPPMFGQHPYVWMPPVCLENPCMFGCPIYFDAPPVCLDTPYACMHPLYVWTPPICLDAPIDAQHKESMLCHTKGVSICPHTFGCPLYVWMRLMFGHPHMCSCHLDIQGVSTHMGHMDAP